MLAAIYTSSVILKACLLFHLNLSNALHEIFVGNRIRISAKCQHARFHTNLRKVRNGNHKKSYIIFGQCNLGVARTAFTCAPLKSSVDLAISSKITATWAGSNEWTNVSWNQVKHSEPFSSTFILREWISRIIFRPRSVGSGSSILRSSRPERSKAGSRISGRLDAAMTCVDKTRRSGYVTLRTRKHHLNRGPIHRFTNSNYSCNSPTLIFSVLVKPSNWFSSSSMVRCTSRSPDLPLSYRLVPMASSCIPTNIHSRTQLWSSRNARYIYRGSLWGWTCVCRCELTSSMKMMAPAAPFSLIFSFAILKASLTSFGDKTVHR